MRDIETLTDKEVEDINKRLVFPSLEDGKKVFFDAISNCNYIDGKDYIDKVFDENSDLYVIEDEILLYRIKLRVWLIVIQREVQSQNTARNIWVLP